MSYQLFVFEYMKPKAAFKTKKEINTTVQIQLYGCKNQGLCPMNNAD